ncbi:uncharacterized protein LOC129694905 isoform X2 [Leucoraja erinacea]|uniref:uncharacterized protein LOC129694905 isoform X2 n=1 Tax=Leucoraja erinaceus TaxID=7782 RepID=UPI002454FAD1|nr:uncharacterized protein LOC129694905 isoform X2 [Leucoraja erinacea]
MMKFHLLILTFGTVTELPRPTITLTPNGPFEEGNNSRIDCRIPGQYTSSKIYLKRYHQLISEVTQTLNADEDTATFHFKNISSENQGSYRCFYQANTLGRWMTSELSEPVEFIVKDKDSSEKPSLPENVWTWVAFVAGGIIMVVITITVVWYFYRKIAKYRRDTNYRNHFWTSRARTDTISIRQSFRFSRDLGNLRENGADDLYDANQNSEYRNESADTENGSNSKPYFITFKEL